MGNVQLNSNKGFNSVVPFPAASNGKNPPTAKKKISVNQTSKTPDENFTESLGLTLVNSEQINSEYRDRDVSLESSIDRPITEPFDFKQTESQLRRQGMADCEFECSEITSYLFVGGYHVAGNWDLLKRHGITRIVNCSSAVVENHFAHEPGMSYHSINMVDGRQDDIFWFLCDIIQFILRGRTLGEKVLIHCEKGVSRSCSFAIAYRMWSAGEKWKAAFEYVKARRPVCAPNTAFTCNLIEVGEIFAGEAVTRNLIFRMAFHLPHDPLTGVLKLCRNAETRKIIVPSTSMLDPRGVFVIRTTDHDTNNQHLYVWKGAQATQSTADKARVLAGGLFGIVTNTADVCVEEQGSESESFLSRITADGSYSPTSAATGTAAKTSSSGSAGSFYDDLYDDKPSLEEALVFQREHDLLRISRDRPPPLGSTGRESSIQGFETYSVAPAPIEYRREASNRSMDASGPALGRVSRAQSVRSVDAGSRKGSLSKLSLEITAAATAGGNSRLQLDLNKVQAGDDVNGPDARSFDGWGVVSGRKADATVTFALADPPGQTTAAQGSPSGGRTVARSSGEGVVLPHLALPLVRGESSKMPQVTEGDECSLGSSRQTTDRQMSDRNEARESLQLSASRRALIDKINDAMGAATHRSNCESDSGNLSAASTVVAAASDSSVSPAKLCLSTEEMHKSFPTQEVHTDSLPAQRCSSDAYADSPSSAADVRRTDPASSCELAGGVVLTSSSAHTTPMKTSALVADQALLKSPSKSRMLSFVTGGGPDDKAATAPTALRRDSGNGGFALFRQGSKKRVAPIQLDALVDDRKMSDATSSTATTGATENLSRVASPPESLARSGSRQVVGDVSPLHGIASARAPSGTDRPTSGESSRPSLSALSKTSRASVGATSLMLPSAALQRTPSRDRHPDHVGLSRGPTPAEDLASGPPGVAMVVSDSGGGIRESVNPAISPSSEDRCKREAPLSKPKLFQVVSKEDRSMPRSSRRDQPPVFEWQCMGVYDDEDLLENSLLLLLCPALPHYIWVGGEFSFAHTGVADPADDTAVLSWIASVQPGEVKVAGGTGGELVAAGKVSLVRSGDETESFWTAFNEGF